MVGKLAGLALSLRLLDGRWLQIAFLASLLSFGLALRDFQISAPQIAATFCAALTTQALGLWAARLPLTGTKPSLSAIVTSLGICILLRADALWVHPSLACIAIASKFVLRAGHAPRSHVFNPANLAAGIAALSGVSAFAWATPWVSAIPAWLSPAQWGTTLSLGAWVLALGGLVTGHIGRRDISLMLLVCWASLIATRLWWLGYPSDLALRMWLQPMSSGALLIFAFFMISDPMTTPQTRPMRLVFAALVALAGFVWQYLLYQPHGLILALLGLSPLVPWLNRWRAQARFAW